MRTPHYQSFVLLAAVLCTLVLAAGGVFAAEAAQGIVYFEDFAGAGVGTVPADWYLNLDARARIVADPLAASGKAAYVEAVPGQPRDTHVRGPAWSAAPPDAETLAMEFKIRWIQGGGINLYASSAQAHHINLHINEAGQLSYRYARLVALPGAVLDHGWNRIRIVADRRNDEVFVYLNDMEEPVGGPLPFRSVPDSWQNLYFLVLHTQAGGNSGTPPQALYTDFKVWVPDPSEPLARRRARSATWVGDLPKRPPVTFEMLPATVSLAEVELRVTEDKGHERLAQPVTSGVPMPRGHIWDPEEVRLIGSAGQEIPLQTSVLSRWPDGSIRWLLLDFQASLSPWEEREYTLQYGSAARPSTRSSGIAVTETVDAVSVSTGPLQIVFGKQAPLIRSLTVNGEKWDGAGAPSLVIEGVSGLRLDTAQAPYELTIEEQGDNRVVVRIQGEMYTAEGRNELDFAYDMRLHFYAGSTVLRIDPTITNLFGEHLMNTGRNTALRAVSLSFPGWLGAQSARFSIATESGAAEGAGRVVALVQSEPNAFTVNVGDETIAAGKRAPGWAVFETDKRSIGLGVRHFWQQAPKAIVLDDTGSIVVELWSPAGGTLHMGGGEAKRHELYLTLSEKDAQAFPGILYPLRAVAPPSWYSTTEAFGRPFFLVTKEELPLYDPSVALYEAFVENAYERLLSNRDMYNEYGWRNFGDWSTTWDPDGWGNSEYDLAYAYFSQFARSGHLGYFELAETAARHWMDIDMIWASNNSYWVGGGLIHSTAHRSYDASDHTWNQGLIDYYHLTGDRRAYEAARAIGDFFARLALERPQHNRPRIQNRPDGGLPTRGKGWALMALVAIYESTLDPYYLEAARAVVDIIAEEQEADGQWRYVIPANEIESRPNATKTFMTALILRGLGDYYRVTQEERALEMLLKGLQFIVDNLWSDAASGYPYIDHPSQLPSPSNTNLLLMDAYAYAYEATGDPRYVEIALKGFEAILRRHSVSDRHLGKTVAQGLRHTPHALAVLMQPKEMVLDADRIELDSNGQGPGELRIVRSKTDSVLAGRLVIEGVPEGLHIAAESLAYTVVPGDVSTALPLHVTADPTVEPGIYALKVRDPDKPDLAGTLTISLPGVRIIDPFDPPLQQHAWFGTWSFEMTEDKSSGWIYDQLPASSFFGDSGRLRRSQATSEYLIYDAPGFYSFALTLYVPESAVDTIHEHIEIAFSPDGTTWEIVAATIEWDAEHDGYVRGTVRPQTAVRRGDGKLKVTVLASAEPDAVQLGRMEIIGWK